MRRVITIIGICSLAMVLAAVVTRAQQAPAAGPAAPPAAGRGGGGGGQAAAPENLKVLPKSWTGQQVRALMQTFNTSLGVQCSYCHSADPNAPPAAPGGRGPATNYTLDLKEEKEIARKMITMVMSINGEDLKGLGDATVPEKVTCYTCHMGAVVPMTSPKEGWGRGSFSLLPAGPPAPARGGPPPAGAPAPPAGN